MNAGRRHRPDGARAANSPVVWRETEKFVLAEIALDLKNGSQFARRDASHQIDDWRLEPSLMAYAEDDSGAFTGLHHPLRVGERQT